MNVVAAPPNPFLTLWAMGYRHLTPITPPRCALTPHSAIVSKDGFDARGKAPGVRGQDGLWRGHDFVVYAPDETDCERWHRMGAGVGIVCIGGVVAIDADCLRESDAEIVAAEIEQRFGLLPCRIGRAPKRLYVLRTEPTFGYAQLRFGEKERVEILAGGKKQFVAHGVHPGTMAPYRWVRKLLPASEIPYASPEALIALLEALRAKLPKAEAVTQTGSDREVDPESLRGPSSAVRKAVASTPNTSALFPTRESYVGYGMAIKAALSGEPDSGFGVYAEWCARWDGGENDPDVVAADWRRMKPTKRGASWLYEMAETVGRGFTRAEAWHEVIPDEPESIFAAEEEKPEVSPVLPTVSAWELVKTPAPPQRWLVEGFMPTRCVTLLYGDGSAGKSLLSLQLGHSVATGALWLGLSTQRGPALFVTAEDEIDEVHRRLAGIIAAEGSGGPDRYDLHVLSLNGEDAVLAAPNGKTGLMEITALYKRLRATIERLRPTVLVLDTLADLFGGDEVKRIQARQFIGLMTALTLRLDFELSVVLLAHPSVNGMSSGTGTSGNTAWSNSVRSRLYLRRVTIDEGKVEPDPDLRILTGKKTNRTRNGGEISLRWSLGRFIPVDSAQVAATVDEEAGEHEEAFLAALTEFTLSGRVASDGPKSPNYAPRLFSDLACTGRSNEADLTGAMNRLFARGEIRLENYGRPSRPYSKIVRCSAPAASLFD